MITTGVAKLGRAGRGKRSKGCSLTGGWRGGSRTPRSDPRLVTKNFDRPEREPMRCWTCWHR